MKDKSYFIYLLGNILVLSIIIIITFFSSQYFVIAHDDMVVCFVDKNNSIFHNFFTYVYHGRYISNIMVKLQCGLFDIHPIVWIRTYGAIMKAVFLFFVLHLLSSTLFLFQNENSNKKLKYVCIPLVTLFCYFIYQFSIHGGYEDMLYTFFYGFVFPFIFFILFWNKFIPLYINKKVLTTSDLKYLCILSFFLGISNEIIIFVSFITLSILFFSDYIKKCTLIKQYVLPFILFLLSSIFYVINPAFLEDASSKNILNHEYEIKELILNLIPEFLNQCIFTIKEYFSIPTFFILFFIALIIIRKKYNVFFVKIVLLLLSSTYLFYILLFFAGKAPGNVFYALHPSTNIQIVIILVYIYFILISFIDLKKYFKLAIIFLSLFYILFFKVNFIDNINKICIGGINNYTSYGQKDISKNRYIFDSIILFYAKNGKQMVIPKFYLGFPINIPSYLENVYNIKYTDISNAIYLEADDAYKKYLQDGGRAITNEEIEKGDFQQLKEEYTQKDNK